MPRSAAGTRRGGGPGAPAGRRARSVPPARLLWERRPVSYFHWTGLEQHTNASQTVRAVSLLYALTGCVDAPGGNVRPSRPPVNNLAPLSLFPDGQPAKAIGLAERPLGPARRGWATAADAYRAMRHGTPYPVRGMVGFGTNLLLSAPGAGGARAARAGPALPPRRPPLPPARRGGRRLGAAGLDGVGARGPAGRFRADAGR